MSQTNTQEFHPVIQLPEGTPVLDLSLGRPITARDKLEGYAIGRYLEKRPGIYSAPLFGGIRDIHVGIDFFAPVGEPIYAFTDCEVFLMEYRGEPGDYGTTVVTKQVVRGKDIYALFGHLDIRSLIGKAPGTHLRKGDTIGWVGDTSDNGGWVPHLHFQLSVEPPGVCDMPGVVSEKDLKAAEALYPDPRLVLGPIY